MAPPAALQSAQKLATPLQHSMPYSWQAAAAAQQQEQGSGPGAPVSPDPAARATLRRVSSQPQTVRLSGGSSLPGSSQATDSTPAERLASGSLHLTFSGSLNSREGSRSSRRSSTSGDVPVVPGRAPAPLPAAAALKLVGGGRQDEPSAQREPSHAPPAQQHPALSGASAGAHGSQRGKPAAPHGPYAALQRPTAVPDPLALAAALAAAAAVEEEEEDALSPRHLLGGPAPCRLSNGSGSVSLLTYQLKGPSGNTSAAASREASVRAGMSREASIRSSSRRWAALALHRVAARPPVHVCAGCWGWMAVADARGAPSSRPACRTPVGGLTLALSRENSVKGGQAAALSRESSVRGGSGSVRGGSVRSGSTRGGQGQAAASPLERSVSGGARTYRGLPLAEPRPEPQAFGGRGSCDWMGAPVPARLSAMVSPWALLQAAAWRAAALGLGQHTAAAPDAAPLLPPCSWTRVRRRRLARVAPCRTSLPAASRRQSRCAPLPPSLRMSGRVCWTSSLRRCGAAALLKCFAVQARPLCPALQPQALAPQRPATPC